MAEVGLPEGDGNEIPADCPLEEELKAPRILGLEGNDVLALFVPLLELGGPRKSKSSDSMGRLGYLVACGQVAARDDVERVSGYLGGCHCLFLALLFLGDSGCYPCSRWDSNPQPKDLESFALPLSYESVVRPHYRNIRHFATLSFQLRKICPWHRMGTTVRTIEAHLGTGENPWHGIRAILSS